jgi:hypothetical protein
MMGHGTCPKRNVGLSNHLPPPTHSRRTTVGESVREVELRFYRGKCIGRQRPNRSRLHSLIRCASCMRQSVGDVKYLASGSGSESHHASGYTCDRVVLWISMPDPYVLAAMYWNICFRRTE